MRENKSICECGFDVGEVISSYITNAKRVCPRCGKINNIDLNPINWDVIADADEVERNRKRQENRNG